MKEPSTTYVDGSFCMDDKHGLVCYNCKYDWKEGGFFYGESAQ